MLQGGLVAAPTLGRLPGLAPLHRETLDLERRLLRRGSSDGRRLAPLREFRFQVRTAAGAREVRTVLSWAPDLAQKRLWNQGCTILDMQEQPVPRAGRMPPQALVVFTRQLAVMLGAGIPIAKAVRLLYLQCDAPPLKRALREVLADLLRGRALSQAMEAHPAVFPVSYTSVVALEQEGCLTWALGQLAEDLEHEQNLRRRVANVLMYPAFVLAFGLLLAGVMCATLLPRFREILVGLHADLPLSTRLLFGVTDFLNSPLFLVVGALGIAAGAAACRLMTPERWERLVLTVPVLRRAYLDYHLLASFRYMHALAARGVLLDRQLLQVADVSGSALLRRVFLDIYVEIKWGADVGRAFGKHEAVLGRMTSSSMTMAYTTGSYDSFLRSLVEMAKLQVESTLESAVHLMEPLCMIVLGGLGGFAVYALFVPLYGALMKLGG